MKTTVWNITTECNQACAYCFGPSVGKKELTSLEAKEKINEFLRKGIQKLVFTGGEPLLRYDIIELVKLAKSKGIFTILHTNGLLINRLFINKINKYLDQINLPLDGFNEKTNNKLRTEGHFEKLMLVLKMLKNKNIRIIISSVATKINKNYIEKIGDIIPDYISKWRIFQFKPTGKAKKVEKIFAVSDNEFAQIYKNINESKYPFIVQLVNKSDKEFDNSYQVEN